jgi:transposase
MNASTLVGIDLGKHTFYLHGQDDSGRETFRENAFAPAGDLGSRLLGMPCVGPITASLLASEVGDGKQFRCGRDFEASVGLVPKRHITSGKVNLQGISKRGGKNLRRLEHLTLRVLQYHDSPFRFCDN